jgi:flagellar M-ring protein FliF
MNNDINFQTPDENPDDIGFNGVNGFDPDADIENIDLGGPGEFEDGDAGTDAAGEPEPERHRFVMPDRFSISGIWRSARDYWNGFSRQMRIIIASSAGGLLLFAVIMTVVLNQSPWVRVYGAADRQEASEIVMILDASRLQYDWDPALNIFSVKQRDEARFLGTLAAAGYFQTGVIFEEETSGGFMETQQEKANREKRNRERRLEAALDTIGGINFSTVTLTIPDNTRVAIQSERVPAQAAVVLHLKPGFILPPEAVKGIENLVQKSVENLLPENITINDGSGVQLNIDTEENPEAKFLTIADLQDDFERRREREIRDDIMDFLSGPFGADGVRVRVAVQSDFDDLITEAKRYTGSNINHETDEQQGIVSGRASDFILETTDPDELGYGPGVLNPEAYGYYDFTGDPSGGRYREEFHQTEERLVNYILTQSQSRGPKIVNLSIGVMVDAHEIDPDFEDYFYNVMATSTGINNIVIQNLTDDMDYDELLRRYVAIAAMPFFRPDFTPPFRQTDGMQMFEMLMILGSSVIVIIIIVIAVVAAVNRKTREREAFEAREAAILATAGLSAGMDTLDPSVASLSLAIGKRAAADDLSGDESDEIASIEAKEKVLKRQIKLFADQNPDIAAQLIRTLIKGDEVGG